MAIFISLTPKKKGSTSVQRGQTQKGREKHQQLLFHLCNAWSVVWHLNDAVSVVSAEDEAICGQQRHLVLTSPNPRDLPQTIVMITMMVMMTQWGW